MEFKIYGGLGKFGGLFIEGKGKFFNLLDNVFCCLIWRYGFDK